MDTYSVLLAFPTEKQSLELEVALWICIWACYVISGLKLDVVLFALGVFCWCVVWWCWFGFPSENLVILSERYPVHEAVIEMM